MSCLNIELIAEKTKHTWFYFLMLEGIVTEQLWTVSHHFCAACSFLPWVTSNSFSTSHGTLLITVQWGWLYRQIIPSITFPHADVFHDLLRTRWQLPCNNHCLPSLGARTTGFWVKVVHNWNPIPGAQSFMDVAPGWAFLTFLLPDWEN